ncbi:testis-expressed protein 264-like isoform X2 [Lycorma delicatula]|uniref:testis-expressed protein 264-like isoform X2 n=1 Tax=Lycorma delicatula TaxID=130591 RepID=UPI003F50E5CF
MFPLNLRLCRAKMPAVLNNVRNLLFCTFGGRFIDIMFSRVTLLAYFLILILFVFDCFVKYYESWLKLVFETNTVLSSVAGERPFTTISLSILLLVALYIVVNLLLIHIKATYIKFRSGRPPVGRLIIAYKFILQDCYNNEKVITKTQQLFPNKKLIQIYYYSCKILGAMGVAYGAIISDDGVSPDDDTRHFLFKNNFRLFSTPAVDNAVHIVCPVISWLLLPTYYIVLNKIYPRLRSYCEKRSLSAYPVIEILEKDGLTLLAPLCRQDAFVVEEAEELFRSLNHAEASLSNSSGYTPSLSLISRSKS